MEIHKLKPVHSWRERLTEVGVFVSGVYFVLAVEQMAEWLHWHEHVMERGRR